MSSFFSYKPRFVVGSCSSSTVACGCSDDGATEIAEPSSRRLAYDVCGKPQTASKEIPEEWSPSKDKWQNEETITYGRYPPRCEESEDRGAVGDCLDVECCVERRHEHTESASKSSSWWREQKVVAGSPMRPQPCSTAELQQDMTGEALLTPHTAQSPGRSHEAPMGEFPRIQILRPQVRFPRPPGHGRAIFLPQDS
eukprot:gnl/MRDRNA2_/MRDRNA2_89548_c0_seq1.p1 gnl/MRDRNA2_/MRDRNA2_89548_c0~~gnl/MRDRNA2_/MRDRNA2_89548_c0_seq1.p1  ORF type:complete len:197 (-),score=24.77 gnl/MRDRNA2_/MRDRNA2_89548_c0_seq1:24-614(-)